MEKYQSTYNTIKKVFEKVNDSGISAYMVGGVSAAIQTKSDLYRKNSDIDLMVDKEDLEKLTKALEELGYEVDDRRGNLTRNRIDKDGTYHSMDHELNANIKDNDMLGVGIFLYERKQDKIITTTYAFDEEKGCTVGTRTVMPSELFDLVYNGEDIDYKEAKVKSQSIEYTYLSKSKGTRDKDKEDAKFLEEHIGISEKVIIDRIKTLENRVQRYKLDYDKDGKVTSLEKEPETEDRIKSFIENIIKDNTSLNVDELKRMVLNNEDVKKYIASNEDLKNIMSIWENTKIEQDVAEEARKIAHSYFYEDKEDLSPREAFIQSLKVEDDKKDSKDKKDTIEEVIKENDKDKNEDVLIDK